MVALEPTVAGMYDAGRPAVLIAWIECESCGRIDKAAHDFNYPADMASDMQLFVWLPCERCGRLAKLHNATGIEARALTQRRAPFVTSCARASTWGIL